MGSKRLLFHKVLGYFNIFISISHVLSLGWRDPLEEGMVTHPSLLAWESPWTEEPGGLQSIGSQSVGHNLDDLAAVVYVQILRLF